jgi:hypothetical protein
MTALTPVILAAMLIGALSGRYWVALAIGGATPIGAALLAGDNAVPTFYLAAVGALVGVVLRQLRSLDLGAQANASFAAATPLLLFAGWAIVTTVLAPVLFYNTIVFLGPNPDSKSNIPATLTTSNIAQIGYLVLGLAVVFFLAHSRNLGSGVVGIAASLVTILSFWRYLHTLFGAPFPEGLFDNNTTYTFIETLPGGAPRFRGILSEPAGLALSSIVTIAYSVSRASQTRGLRRVGVLAVAVIAAVMAANSTSATFVVVAVILALIAVIAFVVRLVRNDGTPKYLAVLIVCAGAVAALYALPYLAGLVSEVVGEKLGTSSYSDRTLTDNRSFQIVFEKIGFGVGLGSNRSSSFTAFLLSTTGVVGFGLFVWAVVATVRPIMQVKAMRPALWALVALLISKVVSAPDLADSSGILYLSLGVLAWQNVQQRRAGGLVVEGFAGNQDLRRSRTLRASKSVDRSG